MSSLSSRFLFFVLCISPGLTLAEALELTADQVANLELATVTVKPREVGLPQLMYPHPELGCGCGERLGDRFRYGWTIA